MAVELKAPGKVLIVLMGLGLLGYAGYKYGWFGGGPRGSDPASSSGSGAASGAKVTVDILYGTEKDRWLNAALDEFRKARPEIEVRAKGMETIDSIRAIVEGREKPAVWSPADEIALNLLDSEWSLAKGASILEKPGEAGAQSLVLTPLVVIAWEERAKAVEKAGSRSSFWRGWSLSPCPSSSGASVSPTPWRCGGRPPLPGPTFRKLRPLRPTAWISTRGSDSRNSPVSTR